MVGHKLASKSCQKMEYKCTLTDFPPPLGPTKANVSPLLTESINLSRMGLFLYNVCCEVRTCVELVKTTPKAMSQVITARTRHSNNTTYGLVGYANRTSLNLNCVKFITDFLLEDSNAIKSAILPPAAAKFFSLEVRDGP